MRFRSFLLFALPLLVLAAGSGCRIERVYNPGPIRVACQSEEQMRKGIKEGLKKREWSLAKDEPGHIEATVHVRDNRADIAIDYDKEKFSIRYLDSEDLQYMKLSENSALIHCNYNRWIRYLVRDITVAASYAE